MVSIYEEYLKYHEKYVEKYGKDNTLVLLQVGSFYECYSTNFRGPNLFKVSEITNVVCTKKNKSIKEISIANPLMLGFNIISANRFISMLVLAGYTIIQIDQITPPPDVKREVTCIHSAGTMLDNLKTDSNFIVSIYIQEEIQNNGKYLICSGMSAIDLSTNKIFYYEEFSNKFDDKYGLDSSVRFLNNFSASETILTHNIQKNGIDKDALISYLELSNKTVHYNAKPDKKYSKLSYQNEFLKLIYPDCGNISPLEFLDIEQQQYMRCSLVILLDYVYEHNKKIINNLSKPQLYFEAKNLVLGNNAIYQLNIVDMNETIKKSEQSLYQIVENASTNMGKRLLKSYLVSPIVNIDELNNIYDCVDEMRKDNFYLAIEKDLNGIQDIERMEMKFALSVIHPFELANLIISYNKCGLVLNLLKKNEMFNKKFKELKFIKEFKEFIIECDNIYNIDELKNCNLSEISPHILKKGISKKVDDLQEKLLGNKNFMENICSALSGLIESRAKKNIGVVKRKVVVKKVEQEAEDDDKKEKLNIIIKQNDRDGYYLSLTKLRADSLKNSIKNNKILKIGNTDFDLSQLIFKEVNKNSTKIIFPHLEEISNDLVAIEEELKILSKEIFLENIKQHYIKYKTVFKEVTNIISFIDYIKSNAKTSVLYNYCKPTLEKSENSYIECEQLRHPIIERIINHEYVPHDISLGKDLKGLLIYGINSAGKSSFMKQIGICIIMAQAGLFVPAKKCILSPYRALYTRILGNDNIYKGLSSFVLEMLEVKAIYRRADKNTLVIGDEVCRSTELISAVSIVASTIIFLSKINATFIFATHLHEIAEMERIKVLKNVKAVHLSVEFDSKNDELVYSREIKEGSGERIYGITVAKYIMQDKAFSDMTLDIKNELTGESNTLLTDKRSKYNSSVFIHECQLCHEKSVKGNISNLETHHINFQKNCKNGFVDDKQHIKKNDAANLIILCSTCHDKIHNGEIKVDGYVMTSKRKKIKQTIIEKPVKKN